ncbi:MAG: glycosyltransferase [Candidatus Thiodiazotropha sp.]
MRVLHVETGRHLYGGAKQVAYLLGGLQQQGVTSWLVCPTGSAMADAVRERVAAVYEMPMGGDLDLGFILRLKRLIRELKPDILHLHSRRGADLLGGLAGRLSGVRVVHSRRVDNPESPWVVKWKYRLYDRVIGISQGIVDVLADEGVPREKLVCVRSAVDVEAYQRSCERAWFLGQFGLPDDALGQGPLKEELSAEIKRLGLQEQVKLAGFRDDLAVIYPCLDLLVHPALMEGLGVSLLQAASAGLPIVAVDAGGMPEAVEDGVSGLLVPPASTTALENAVSRLLGDPQLRRQMGESGRERMRRGFSVEQMVEGNLRVYQELLNEF